MGCDHVSEFFRCRVSEVIVVVVVVALVRVGVEGQVWLSFVSEARILTIW